MKTVFGTIGKTALSASALALAVSAQVNADMHKKHDESSAKMGGKHAYTDVEKRKNWQAMQDKVINANEVLDADVTNGLNPMGDVRDLVLSADKDQVEYILYEVPFPYSFYGAEDGYVTFDNAAFEPSVGADMQVRIDDEASARTPEQLKLEREEADHRMLSNLIGEDLVFSNEKNSAREIENVLVNRKSGEIEAYVIQMDEDSLFNEEPRAVPADEVDIDDRGHLTTDVSFAKVEDMQHYAPEFLK